MTDPATPLLRTVTIRNERGLHARPASKVVKCVQGFDAQVSVTKDGERVPASSIMGLLMLAASQGQTLELSAEGAQAVAALDALTALIEDGFGELD